jgi:hypothetical protein
VLHRPTACDLTVSMVAAAAAPRLVSLSTAASRLSSRTHLCSSAGNQHDEADTQAAGKKQTCQVKIEQLSRFGHRSMDVSRRPQPVHEKSVPWGPHHDSPMRVSHGCAPRIPNTINHTREVLEVC